ncbi:MAG: hypothetical protein KKA97_00955, partial [Actinobacteria bacterium]|nr:hypothetical protein [Actinomycetota bacterium]
MSTAAARDADPAGTPGASSSRTEIPSRVPWIGFWAAVALVLVATFGPDLVGWQVYARSDPDGTPGSLTPTGLSKTGDPPASDADTSNAEA